MVFIQKRMVFTACSLAVLLSACGGGSGGEGGSFDQGDLDLGAATDGAGVGDNTVQANSTMDLVVPRQFDWSNNNEIELQLALHDSMGQPAARTGVMVYAMPEDTGNEEPTDAELLLATKLFNGVSDANGLVNITMQAPGHVISASHVYVKTKLIGVTSSSVVPLDRQSSGARKASWVFGPMDMSTQPVNAIDPNVLINEQSFLLNDQGFLLDDQPVSRKEYMLMPFGNYYHWFYGHMPATRDNRCDIFNASGPTLCTSDVSSDELQRINEIVAEGNSPSDKFLEADSNQSNLVFNQKANVVVTFLHEGAGFKNSFGFFTYNSNAEPTDPLALNSEKILFPNTSYQGSGGFLESGDSVALGEIDPAFGDDAIGFWIAADGWNHDRGQGQSGQQFYSLDALNPEQLGPEQSDIDRKHMVLVSNSVDEATNTRRLWVAVEDIRLDSGRSDRDYNDLIMQVDVFPADALTFGDDIPSLDDGENASDDFDNDGVIASDDIDDEDPLRAFERYYPGENTWGTLLAEDNWPVLGDFDMNDMVVRYRTREVYDSANRVKDLNIEYRLEARGAAFHNGFAVSLGDQIFADNIESAELNGEAIQPLPDASFLAYEIFGDTWAHTFQGDANCWTYNTMSDCPMFESTDFTLSLSFANPVEQSQMLQSPYNPFLVAYKTGTDVPGYTRNTATSSELYTENGEIKDIEIHLPFMPPTQGQDMTMFGTGDDASDGVERYYVSGDNLPWIIDIPDAVEYPEEFVDISAAYPAFGDWVQSSGTESKDWYRFKAEDDGMIYTGPSDEGEPTLAAANGIVVSDNFQDQMFVPFNLQVRNTTGKAVRWEALLENVGYASIPNLNLNGATLVSSDNGDGTYNHLFSGANAPYQGITMFGGVVEPVGNGTGLRLFAE